MYKVTQVKKVEDKDRKRHGDGHMDVIRWGSEGSNHNLTSLITSLNTAKCYCIVHTCIASNIPSSNRTGTR